MLRAFRNAALAETRHNSCIRREYVRTSARNLGPMGNRQIAIPTIPLREGVRVYIHTYIRYAVTFQRYRMTLDGGCARIG